jgi:hypothetical protein
MNIEAWGHIDTEWSSISLDKERLSLFPSIQEMISYPLGVYYSSILLLFDSPSFSGPFD